jgi:hypothetical protein
MGCFSFICKESGLPVASSSFDGDACRMYLLKNGKVIEEMRGHYDSYGRVFHADKEDSFKWKMEWGKVVDLMFHPDERNGMAVVLEKYYKEDSIPTTRSEGDPNQGWGKRNGGNVIITEPYHKIY